MVWMRKIFSLRYKQLNQQIFSLNQMEKWYWATFIFSLLSLPLPLQEITFTCFSGFIPWETKTIFSLDLFLKLSFIYVA